MNEIWKDIKDYEGIYQVSNLGRVKSVRRNKIRKLCVKPKVNHIDEDKTNNSVDNLEWVTAKENTNHGTRNKRVGDIIRIVQKNRIDLSKRVLCSNGEIYPSINEACRVLKINSSYIVKVLKGERKHAHGYSFNYID